MIVIEQSITNIVVREDGKGYSGGAVKFELKFNNNFRDLCCR